MAEAAKDAAFCAHDSARLAGARHGPLAGLEFAVKDVFAIEGVRACYGNPTWLSTHAPAAHTASVVRALLAAGGSLTGVTVTDELALSLTGENVHYGAPRNPRCPARVCGGSSAGSAAAVALGHVPFALGTDTGGSVRVPASHTGLCGYRPSHGAISLDGVLPLAPRFDTVGVLAADPSVLERVARVALAPAALGRADLVRPRSLIGWTTLRRFMDPGAWTAFMAGAEVLGAALDREIVWEDPVELPLERVLDAYLTLQNLEAKRELGGFLERERFLERTRPLFGSLIARRFGWVLESEARRAPLAEATRESVIRAIARAHESGAWLVIPSAPGIAPLRGLADDTIDEFTGRALSLSAFASLSGAPQLSLPLTDIDDCPLGVSLLGPRGSDLSLIACARAALGRTPYSGALS